MADGIETGNWLYMLDGRQHGPIPLEELKSLAGTCGETARDITARPCAGGDWIPLDELTLPPLSRDTSTKRAPLQPLRARTPRLKPEQRPGLFGLLRRNLDLVAAVVLLVAINALLYAMSSPRRAQERQYLQTLRQIADESEQLQRRRAASDEWAAFRSRAERQLKPMIADLEKTATAHDPIRQHLLWASRDSLLEMLSQAEGRPVGAPADDETASFHKHIEWLEAHLAEAGE